ncbi:S-methyl-5'-thioadenosine phosphorylase [Acyrthosiphon pisum]|uniref:S-methyl-5'-thioadenosine phosphorylase n=2 Tax=Acyrthosiphon pisum TaxID=7029 RepID=A0A8R2A4I7_ACYPI|nr:S-methyl-5'-thioadenosine phosphorylase [Acyrthosiphon pisum]|eukprot:XP_001945751.3 PREDICTED: S-methyl-5'-thioadenosine phosphorylase [Acyrthosiphon pisum]
MKYNVKIGIIGGSGLDDPDFFKDATEERVKTPYGDPSDSLLSGKLNGINCVLLARHGRKHSISPTNINYRANIWALKHLGCTHIIASTATGSLKEEIKPGDLVILDSFIDLTKKRELTMFDKDDKVIHLPIEPPFCSATRNIIIETAQSLGIPVHKTGTAVVIEGPRFSTKAESNVYRSWNADLVNMTLAPEVVLAKEAGLLYASVAMATDYDCWREATEKVNVANVIRVFQENVKKITTLFIEVLPKIAEKNWDVEIDELNSLIQESVQSK